MDETAILVVDDERDFGETVAKRLKRRGFLAESVQSGEEALDVLSRRPIDVVILDVMMPGMNGLELLRHMKEMRPGVEAIVVTGHASVRPGGRCSTMEAGACLLKPVDFEELLQAIASAKARADARGNGA